MKKIIILLAAAVLTLAFAAVAMAHAEIKSCTPEINGTVAAVPDKVVCTTSEAMDPKGSSLAVFDAMGMQVDKKDSAVDLNDPDRVTIAVSLDTAMMKDGVYTVKWTTLSAADSDEANGEFKFTVGSAMQMDVTPSATGTDTTEHPNGDSSIGVVNINGRQVTLKIVAPVNDAQVPTGMAKVDAALDGAVLGENGSHLHFYVDDNLALMGQGGQTSAEVEIKDPGEHEIKVTYSDKDHTDLMQVHVHVMANAAAAQATAEPTMAMEPTHAAEPTSAPVPTATAAAQPTTMPTSGGQDNTLLIMFLAGIGAGIIGAGVYAAVRARR